jgi:glycosyltransferase involved in cell wall biosynthesis
MRIAVIAPPWFRVPPRRYGGIEAVVALLADGLVDVGHDVTLFASGDSETRARLRSAFDAPPRGVLGHGEAALEHMLAYLACQEAFDVVSDHTGPLGIALCALADAPALHTVHGPLTGAAGRVYASLAHVAPHAAYASLSHAQREPLPDLAWEANIPNGIDLAAHPQRSAAGGDYLLWLGRMTEEKAPDLAISIAEEAGIPLVLAGKRQDAHERHYFAEQVEPRLGRGAVYVGEVGLRRRVKLLHGAIALLNPIQWPEPFGLVMCEAMACGVPVLATRRGSTPEVVEHGRSGLLADDWRDLVGCIDAARALDPAECRQVVVERFSVERMVAGYEDALGRVATPRASSSAAC